MKLSQGTKTVKDYLHAFNNLDRYALEFVNTDAKKIASFQRGLSPKMVDYGYRDPSYFQCPHQ